MGYSLGDEIPDAHRIAASSSEELQTLFSLQSPLFEAKNKKVLVDAHRGGARKGFPENCIATFEDTLKHIPAVLEIDPRITKDGIVVLMHDATLDRTTNGTGKVKDYTYEELQRLRLKDGEGNLTDFRIPTLKEAITWAKGKTILFLDKKDVPLETTMKILRELKAESWCMVIVYNYNEAKQYYTDNPNIMMEAFITKTADVERFGKTGVPWKNVIPFVGVVEPEAELYRLLREKNRPCMIGCTRAIDRSVREAGNNSIYKTLAEQGASIMETDLPLDAHQAIKR